MLDLPNLQVRRRAVIFRNRGVGIAVKIKDMAHIVPEYMFCRDKKMRGDGHSEIVIEFPLILPARVITGRGGVVSGVGRLKKNDCAGTTAAKCTREQREKAPDHKTHTVIITAPWLFAIKSALAKPQSRCLSDQPSYSCPPNPRAAEPNDHKRRATRRAICFLRLPRLVRSQIRAAMRTNIRQS